MQGAAQKKLFGPARLEARITRFRDPKIFCGLSQRRIDPQRFLVLDNGLRSFALAKKQTAEIAVGIGTLRIEPGRFEIMRLISSSVSRVMVLARRALHRGRS